MKLKKIASLALAGIMAVSMLAGCNNGTGSKDEGTTVIPSDLTSKVIAALDEDTTKEVSFSSSSALNAAMAKAAQQVGYDVDQISVTLLHDIDSDISDKDKFTEIGTNDNKDDSKSDAKTSSRTTIVELDGVVTPGASEEYIVKELAEKLDDEIAALADYLHSRSMTYTYDEDDEHYYSFAYTGNVSVVKVTNVVTGEANYAMVYTLTRTATKKAY